MRKGNREITAIDEIISVMEKCDVCRIALNNGDYPYILPLSFGMDYKEEKLTLYFHSALEGMKLDLIKKDNRAAFEMDCEGELEYHREKGYCTYNYASVIGMGKITFVEKDEEKMCCLFDRNTIHLPRYLIEDTICCHFLHQLLLHFFFCF